MKVCYLLKDKHKGLGYYVVEIFTTEAAAIKERKRLIERGEYQPTDLEVVTRLLKD